jgi:hypothetical protein
MIIEPDEKIHVIFRQLFEGDLERHFIGTVEKCEINLVRAMGYLYCKETRIGHVGDFVKRLNVYVRIIPLDCETVVVNVLPKAVNIEKITYKYDVPDGAVRVTDGSDWHLDLSDL